MEPLRLISNSFKLLFFIFFIEAAIGNLRHHGRQPFNWRRRAQRCEQNPKISKELKEKIEQLKKCDLFSEAPNGSPFGSNPQDQNMSQNPAEVPASNAPGSNPQDQNVSQPPAEAPASSAPDSNPQDQNVSQPPAEAPASSAPDSNPQDQNVSQPPAEAPASSAPDSNPQDQNVSQPPAEAPASSAPDSNPQDQNMSQNPAEVPASNAPGSNPQDQNVSQPPAEAPKDNETKQIVPASGSPDKSACEECDSEEIEPVKPRRSSRRKNSSNKLPIALTFFVAFFVLTCV
ncbi:hypothetical protein M153_21640002084 [Pseudoloma neurophilia]|uniref:Uncharacterized protein n=1 Tax=Pseudoloma neurophilia TaxID=146866 RepID=A0A0R0M1K6_9MICR|nr:hypothetical protein M153_21640002084 [Pseudoloma neurophilia]